MTQYYYMKVQSSGQYLNILNASTANGAEACQGTNKATPNFLWEILPEAGGYFFFRVASSSQYLNILNASKANGAMACQGTNNTTPNFLWQFVLPETTTSVVPAPGTPFYLKVKSSGQYLNILNASKANGAEACQGTNNTTDNFLWEIVQASGGRCFLRVKSSGQYLNILNASKANGAEACQGTNNTTDNFLWEIIPAAGGYFHLQVKSSGQYLNILNASKANGAMACQGTDNTTDNFLWQFVLPETVSNTMPAPGTPFYLKVKSSGQYLNILNGSSANGAEACQGTNNTTSNFLWTLERTENLVVGTARPLYEVLTVVYAPPGTNGGKTSSSVDYGSGSSTGTSTSISSSFKDGIDVSVSAGFDIGIVSLGANADFNASRTTTDSSSVDIKKSASYDIKVPGPGADGINHDHDLFYLWLNPLLNITIDPKNNIGWSLGVDGPTMLIQYVYAGWLKNPETMPAGVRQQLNAAGLTTSDYANILALNPFSAGKTTIDPDRFLPTTQSFPYIPPFSSSDPVPTTTFNQQSSVTTTSSHTVQNQYGVSVSVSAGIKTPFTASLKVTGSFTWTNSSTSSASSGATQTAAVTVGGPAYGYTGPTDVLVYWDALYRSFMFAFPTEPPAHTGALVDAAGKPVAYKPVTLKTGSHTLSTFTDPQGQYRFYGVPAGQAKVTSEGRELEVAVGPGTPKAMLKLG